MKLAGFNILPSTICDIFRSSRPFLSFFNDFDRVLLSSCLSTNTVLGSKLRLLFLFVHSNVRCFAVYISDSMYKLDFFALCLALFMAFHEKFSSAFQWGSSFWSFFQHICPWSCYNPGYFFNVLFRCLLIWGFDSHYWFRDFMNVSFYCLFLISSIKRH